jgi:LsmAD domain
MFYINSKNLIPKVLMVHDICVKVKEMGDVLGIFNKATKNSLYIADAIISKAGSIVLAMVKIDRKFIISVKRMAPPSFDNFTNEQLENVKQMNNEKYTEAAVKILSERKNSPAQKFGSVLDAEKESQVQRIIKDFESQCDLSESAKKEDGVLGKSDDKKSKKPSKDKVWNQFTANKEKFGVNPEFDMSHYVQPLDKTSEDYPELLDRSTKLAKEILSQKVTDPHILEERGVIVNNGQDDDTLYSTVNTYSKWDSAPEKTLEEPNTLKEEPIKAKEAQVNAVESINEVLFEDVQKITESIENKDAAQMWQNAKSFLYKKKNILDMNKPPSPAVVVSPVAEKKAVKAEVPLDTAKLDNKSKDKMPSKDGSAEKNRSRDAIRVSSQRMKPFNGKTEVAPKKIEPQAKKPQKEIVLGGNLKFNSVEQCVSSITENFKSNKIVTPWGNGSEIEKRAEMLKKAPSVFPLNDRIAEISLCKLYLGKR